MVAAHIPELGVIARNPDSSPLGKACGAESYACMNAAALNRGDSHALNRLGPRSSR